MVDSQAPGCTWKFGNCRDLVGIVQASLVPGVWLLMIPDIIVKRQLGLILYEILNLYLWAGKFCSLIPEFGVLGQEEKCRGNICALEVCGVPLASRETHLDIPVRCTGTSLEPSSASPTGCKEQWDAANTLQKGWGLTGVWFGAFSLCF